MNWYKRAQSQQQINELERLSRFQKQANNSRQIISNLGKTFPNARFYSTTENFDNLIKHEFMQHVYLIVMWDDVKDQKSYYHYFERPFIVYQDIQVHCFIQSHGFDYEEKGDIKVPNIYSMSQGEFIPIEKTEEITTVSMFADSPDNVMYKIEWNSLRQIQQQKIEVQYNEHPLVKEIENKITNGLSIDGAIKMLDLMYRQYSITDEKKSFIREIITKFYWANRPKEEFINKLQESMGELQQETEKEQIETGRDPYLYYLDLDPNNEGAGKFLIDTDIPKAFSKWGEFNIVIRYHAGRMIYPASKVSKWLTSNDPDDDMAYNFEHQLNGIRDMFIAGKNK